MSVYVSPQISQAKKNEAKEILSKFNADTSYTDHDDLNNVLRVVSDNEIDMRQKSTIPTIAVGSIRAFSEKKINPFKLRNGEKIKNLHLFGKTVAFTGITMPLLSELTRVVLKMGGIIADRHSRVDFRIIKPEKAFSNGLKYIKYDWLYALQQSPHFVDPKDYIFADKTQTQSSLSQSIFELAKSQTPIVLSPMSSRLFLVETSSEESSQLSQLSFKSCSQRSNLSSPEQTGKSPLPEIRSQFVEIKSPAPEARHAMVSVQHTQKQQQEDEDEFSDDDFMFETDLKDIETFARTKICVTPRRCENICDNSKKETKQITMSSVVDFSQVADEEHDSEDEVFYSKPAQKDSRRESNFTLSQDPLMKLLK